MNRSFTIPDIKNSKVAHLNRHLLIEKTDKNKKAKYRNTKVEFDGKIFDSIKERDRYITLRMLQTAGEISDLRCQVEFILEAEDQQICKYISDFTYIQAGKTIVEDVKSKITRRLPVYRLKKKLMLACLGIEIIEV